MALDENAGRGIYELPLPQTLPEIAPIKGPHAPLPDSLLFENALWFCRLRWGIAALLVSYGIFSRLPGFSEYFGVRSPGTWPFLIALTLILTNLAFRLLDRDKASRRSILLNLWTQIITDLLALTIVVYFVGSLETNIAFAYLFHIVLSCIFLSRRQSLAIVVLAIVLFAFCALAEHVLKIVPVMSIFSESSQNVRPTSGSLTLNFLFAVGIWLVVWHLACHLSAMVRQRELELAQTNRRLTAAQEERSRHMLSTTHQLKAPFAAIYSNAQLLERGYCGEIPDEAMQAVRRIMGRSQRLTAEIQEMVQLANLESAGQQSLRRSRIVSTDLLVWCMSQVEPLARKRGVEFKVNVRPVILVGAEDHFKMLFGNLLSNAVTYSHEGGCVHVSCLPGPDSHAVVTIADNGIGIPEGKLPRIFEEHYRTKEAVRHNKESSGLGLAIVRHIAEMYRIRIRVQSRPDAGTEFQLNFPVPDDNPGSTD